MVVDSVYIVRLSVDPDSVLVEGYKIRNEEFFLGLYNALEFSLNIRGFLNVVVIFR